MRRATKRRLILIAILVPILTIPLWGGCNLNYQLCTTWCSIRYFDSEMGQVGCKGRCATDKVECLAAEGKSGLRDLIDGFKGQ